MASMTLSIATSLVLISLLMLLIPSHMIDQDKISKNALAQTSSGADNTFEMNGQIGSLVLGMPPNTKTVDMTTVPKFILSGDWDIDVENGNLTDFRANFYTGPVNGAENHTHQLSNFTVNESTPIQLSPDKSISLSGILDVGTNGNKAWDNVNATVDVSKGRSITINLADEDTERHFMGQQIYGIVKGLRT
ncbi:MAG TPA: hypothetical protein VHH33_10185 [Nitrososphaeraceae archaeon]|jgi:hypothetical protein|nr:hypothetical protein [Nitrososphaeraceae archaeon]